MNRKTRYFLIGSGLVVVVGLCTGLVAFYNGAAPLRAAAGPAELSYVPADAAAIAYADIQGIVHSGFHDKLRSFLPPDSDHDPLFQTTGIDLERDIDSVVAGMRPGDEHSAIVLLRGRFDVERIEELALSHDGVREEYRGKRLLVGTKFDHDGPAPADGTGALAFLEPGLIALGPRRSLEQAIDTADGGTNITDNAPFMTRVRAVEGTGNAWVVGRVESVSDMPELAEQVRTRIPGIEWFAVSARVDNGLSGFVRADAVDPQAAQNLRDVVNGALAMARMAGSQDPRMDMALRSLQTTGDGNTVQVSFTITPELIDLLQSMAPTPTRDDEDDEAAGAQASGADAPSDADPAAAEPAPAH